MFHNQTFLQLNYWYQRARLSSHLDGSAGSFVAAAHKKSTVLHCIYHASVCMHIYMLCLRSALICNGGVSTATTTMDFTSRPILFRNQTFLNLSDRYQRTHLSFLLVGSVGGFSTTAKKSTRHQFVFVRRRRAADKGYAHSTTARLDITSVV